jgi:hypothetical protein
MIGWNIISIIGVLVIFFGFVWINERHPNVAKGLIVAGIIGGIVLTYVVIVGMLSSFGGIG